MHRRIVFFMLCLQLLAQMAFPVAMHHRLVFILTKVLGYKIFVHHIMRENNAAEKGLQQDAGKR